MTGVQTCALPISKLRDFIAAKAPEAAAAQYRQSVAEIRAENTGAASDADGMVMQKEELNQTQTTTNRINGILVGAGVVIVLCVFALIIRRRRRKQA